MANPSGDKGTKAETAIVRWAKVNGFPWADRLTKTGSRDRGDLSLSPGVMIESKSVLSAGKRGPTPLQLEGWMRELRTETKNGGWEVGILVVKREGTTDVGRWWAFVEAHTLAGLIFEKGEWVNASNPGFVYCAPAAMTVADLARILRAAGYGEPLERTEP